MNMAGSTTFQGVFVGIVIPLLFAQSIHAAKEGDCVPIETLLAQNLYEANVNNTNIGGYNTTGALDIWSDNPLHTGSLDGEVVGTSSGKCTLLTEAEVFMCNGIMKISETDTITYAGLSPNNNDRGTLAITGGTGCYEEAQGTFYMTAQGEDYSSFLYEYAPGTSGNENCVPIDQFVGGGLNEVVTKGSTVGDYETPGSKDIWEGNVLYNSNGDVRGHSYGDCTLLPNATTWMCNGLWVLDPTVDTVITFVGYSPNSIDEGVLAVTGGTGCYAGASATLTLMAADENYTSYDWKYKAPPSADDCQSLLETVGGDSTIFQENTGGDLKGDYETAGSLDYWYGNKLYSGSHDGTQLSGASSVGECTLLTNVAEFMCLEQWIIDDDTGTSVVATGFSPNSSESGTLAISGTGCFTGLKGEMSITAESIVEDYDFFSYDIKSTNEETDGTITGTAATAAGTAATTTGTAATTAPTGTTDGGGAAIDPVTEDGTDSPACAVAASFSFYLLIIMALVLL